MEKRPGRTPRAPTGETFVNKVQAKFLRDGLPTLRKDEEWRSESRRVNFATCPPGGCPKPGEWPVPQFNLDD